MALRWHIPLPGPFSVSGRVFPRVRSRSKFWTHPGCHIHHRTKDAANRCKVGRAPAPISYRPQTKAPQKNRTPYTDSEFANLSARFASELFQKESGRPPEKPFEFAQERLTASQARIVAVLIKRHEARLGESSR